MRLLLAEAETLIHCDAGSVVELPARDALQLIALGHADGVAAEAKPAEAKPADKKPAAKATAKK